MAKSTAKRKANPQAAAGGFVPATAGYQARSHGRSHAARPSASARADRAISPSQETSSQKAKRVVRTVAITLLVLIIAGLLAVALYVMNFATQLGKEFGLANSELSQEEQMAITEILEPNEDILQPFYMMLLGSDRRSWNPSDSGRSDTAIIVRVDPQTYTVSMISIPRDTRVYIPGYWTTKFNAAYAYGGASLAIRTASQMTGISLQHFAEVNFQALIDLVDAIGGIDIYVPADVDDVKAGDTFIPKGWNHIDGEQALMLARTRDWIGSDFTRQAFQRQIIKAIINRVLELPATELTSVVKQAAGSILTDMNIGDLFQLALHFKDAEDITFYSANLPSRTQTIDGISYVVLVDEDVQKMLRLFVAGDDPTDFTPVGWEYIDSQVYMGD
ncbi:MAG: LCP family protein [Eggerthellaceae bacterium]|nr:LCP family protein [Eggerthellaceae bacterium]